MRLRIMAIVLLCAVGACSDRSPVPAVEQPRAVERIPVGQLPAIDVDAVLAHTKTLSSDEFEGPAPGTRGEALTVRCLVDQFKKIGLKPGNTDGTYVQKVPLVGITPAPAPLVFRKGAQQQTLKWKDEVVAC